MAQDNLLGITNSLFGTTPTPQSDLEFGLKNIAGRSATEIGTAMTYAGGKQATRGLLNLMGAEDPEQAESNKFKSAVQQANAQGIDTTKPEGMKQVVSLLLNSGDTAIAQKASLLVQAMEQKELDLSKTRAETGKITRGVEQDEKLRAALAELPENATEDDFLRVYRKYGSPDQQARVIEMARQKEADRQMRRDLFAAKQGQNGMTPEKLAQRAEDSQLAVDTINEARNLVSGWSTGYGSLLSGMPNSDARRLQGKLDTIKSNLAAAMIEDMKNQSKTGATGLGALNREELKVLQTSKASLDAGMGADDLKNSLRVIEKYFAARGRLSLNPAEPAAPADNKTPAASGNKRIKFSDMK